jgi:C_GCAxxG_C_C family probable redox protein
MKNSDYALSLFKEGFNCSQSVFTPFAEKLGIEKETALKLSCGFGAGMAYFQETCGAVTGAYMALGLKYGKSKSDENDLRDKTYSLIQDFTSNFIDKHHTTNCRKLINCDLNTDEGKKYFYQNDIKMKFCAECVKDAVTIVEKIMETNI